MPRRSQAHRDFCSSLAVAQTLIKREQRFSDPPTSRNFKIVQGLRGGAMVLIVAAFENYLKEVVEERLDYFTKYPLKFKIESLPEQMIFHNCSQTLDRSLRGPFSGKLSKADKILGFKKASELVVKGVINPKAFSEVARSNPNSKKVRELFKCLGIEDIFTQIKPKFDTKWGKPTADVFIVDTLDFILARRHEVAHAANALSISRVDLQNSIKFIRLLADLCDDELYDHIETIRK